MKKLEVIAWNKADAIRIEQAGAHRVELVVDLERGGLTPPIELVKEVVEAVSIPVRVMVRDTDESFIYNNEIMDSHIKYIESIKEINPDGVIFGSITHDGEINFEQLERVINAKGKMNLTFHRAFDELGDNYLEQFDKLSTYDVDTILTSGTKSSALEGADILRELVDRNTINILPGKSISISNINEIIKKTNADFYHVGYSVREDGTGESPISIEKIQELLKEINND